MSGPLTINPAHLSDDDWEAIRTFLDAAEAEVEVVEFSSRVELLTSPEVAKRLGMSRSTVLRRIADGGTRRRSVHIIGSRSPSSSGTATNWCAGWPRPSRTTSRPSPSGE